MARKYKKPEPTGREYVDSAEEFYTYTVSILEKLPHEWKDYTLDPVWYAAKAVADGACDANGIYMKTDDPEQKVKNYTDRIGCLVKALRAFYRFDRELGRMMRRVDLMQSETKRMKALMWDILHELGIYSEEYQKKKQASDEETPEGGVPEDLKAWTDQVNGKIKKAPLKTMVVTNHVHEIHYTTILGDRRMRLGLTSANKDHLLGLEAAARKYIQERCTKDLAERKALLDRAAAQMSH